MVLSPLRRQLMEVAHGSIMGGHMVLSTGLVFKVMCRDIVDHVMYVRKP